MTLEFDVEAIAEHPPQFGERLPAFRGATGGEQWVAWPVRTAGQDDETLGMALHHRPRHMRRVGRVDVEEGGRRQFAQVAIAGLVLGQEDEGWNPRPALRPDAADPGHRQGTANDRLDSRILGQDGKFQRAEQIRAIRQTHRRHSRLGGHLADGVDLDRALEQRIGRLHPKMDEPFSLHRSHSRMSATHIANCAA